MNADCSYILTNIAVGPSAAPIIPMLAASFIGKNSDAISIVIKIPPWLTIPINSSHGFDSKGPKSIIAPIPIKRSSGKTSWSAIPKLYSQAKIPELAIVLFGILTRIAPKPIGRSKVGSIFFLMAR